MVNFKPGDKSEIIVFSVSDTGILLNILLLLLLLTILLKYIEAYA